MDSSALVAGIDSAAGAARLGSGRALGPIVHEPEAAAVLAGFLVQALHRSTVSLSTRVGKGWRLRDDPVASGALVGGVFDDTGFPARPLELADGDFVTGVLDGPGHYRRPSFRDPPEAMAAHLVLETGVAELPSEGCFVSDVRVLPLDAARCTLWVDGRRHRGGVPEESLEPDACPWPTSFTMPAAWGCLPTCAANPATNCYRMRFAR